MGVCDKFIFANGKSSTDRDCYKTAELIEIPIADWASVDRLEGYPRPYDRRLISCSLADGTEVSGWVYIMNELPDNARVIKCGDWKAHRHGG